MPKRKRYPDRQSLQPRVGTSVLSALHLRVLAGVALIVLAAFLAYFPALSGGFIWDDELLLTNNELIKAADGPYRFWCTTEALDYWPVSNTALWIEWRLWGMNSIGYHVTSLILHILGTLLLWVVLRKLSIPGEFLAAMIFAVHPVNVESVAWIAQRKGLLAMLFCLLSILCYLRQFFSSCSDNAQRSRHTPCADTAHGACGLLIGRWYWLSLGAFVLAMLSKGSVAVLPVLLLIIVWWQRPLTSRDIVRSVPFFMVAVVLAGVNVWFQTHITGEAIRTVTFIQRLLGAGGVVWFYLYKAILPINLVFVYAQWHIQVGNPLWWLPLLTAVSVTAVLWWYRGRWSRPILFAWVFFCVWLAPVMGLTDVYFMKFSLVADHYQHIAMIGVIALLAGGWSVWREQAQRLARWAASAVAVVVLLTLMILTWRQSGLYLDTITLYRATLEKNSECWMVHNNLGFALFNTGRVPEAAEHYQEALRIKPDYPEAHNNLGNVLAKTGRLPEAIEHYKQALHLNSRYPEAHNNLGIALYETGHLQEAIEHYEQALHLNSRYPDAHNNLGNALRESGHLQEAIEHYEQALRIEPDYPDTHNNLGIALRESGHLQEAIEHYEQALRTKPDYPDAHNNLGNALLQAGRLPEAIEHYQQALRIKADYPEAHFNLGGALVQAGRLPEAIEHYQQALRMKPDYHQAYSRLGIALAKAGRMPEAIENFKQALRLKPDFIEAYASLALAYAKAHQSAEAMGAAQKALELARSQGQTMTAKRIEDWLNSYRAGQSK